MKSPNVRVFDRVERARSARTELITAGYRPQDVHILDSRAATLTRYAYGLPIPEALAGLLVCGLMTTILGVIPQFAPLFDRGGFPLYALIVFGALVGAVGSYVLARTQSATVIDRDVADGEYVLVVDSVVEPRAA